MFSALNECYLLVEAVSVIAMNVYQFTYYDWCCIFCFPEMVPFGRSWFFKSNEQTNSFFHKMYSYLLVEAGSVNDRKRWKVCFIRCCCVFGIELMAPFSFSCVWHCNEHITVYFMIDVVFSAFLKWYLLVEAGSLNQMNRQTAYFIRCIHTFW